MTKDLLPTEALRLVNKGKSIDSRDIIVQYLVSEPDAVKLTQQQQTKLARMQECDRLLSTHLHSRRNIISLLSEKFKVSKDTIARDIVDTEYVFGSTKKHNKPYLLSNHLDLIDDGLRMAKKIGDMNLYLKLMELRLKVIKEVPEDNTQQNAPAVLIFDIIQSNVKGLSEIEMSAERAKEVALKALQFEDIDHEVISEDEQ